MLTQIGMNAFHAQLYRCDTWQHHQFSVTSCPFLARALLNARFFRSFFAPVPRERRSFSSRCMQGHTNLSAVAGPSCRDTPPPGGPDYRSISLPPVPRPPPNSSGPVCGKKNCVPPLFTTDDRRWWICSFSHSYKWSRDLEEVCHGVKHTWPWRCRYS